MQPEQAENPFGQPPYNSPAAVVANLGKNGAGNRRTGCLIWTMAGMLCIALAALVVIGAAYAGWNSGVGIARENATSTSAAEVQQQCGRLRADVETGNRQLLRARIDYLQLQTPAPPCLIALLPAATALYHEATPSATKAPTVIFEPTRTAPVIATRSFATPIPAPTDAGVYEYDLPALLSEAQSDISLQNFRLAIDTLDAIIGIDEHYQSDLVGSLFFAALTSEAEALFRTGKLSEAIVVTARAETFGDVGSLNYERYVAETYLDALRLKVGNPGESVRKLNIVAYELGHQNYLNGQVRTELQEAHRNYGDAFAFQGDYCLAREQYDAALNLNPAPSNIHRANVAAKRNEAAEACPALQETWQAPSDSDGGSSTGVGVRPSPVPVGQSG